MAKILPRKITNCSQRSGLRCICCMGHANKLSAGNITRQGHMNWASFVVLRESRSGYNFDGCGVDLVI